MNKFILFLAFFSTSFLSAQSAWNKVYTPAGSEYFSDIHAVTSEKAVMTSEGGRVYRTIDGGQTTELYQVPDNYSIFQSIDFSDTQNGLVGGGCWFPVGECITGALLHTTDGGESWSLSQISNTVGVIQFIQAVNPETIFALGDYAGLFRFNTSTEVWDSLGSPNGLSGIFSGMQFTSETEGFILKNRYENGHSFTTLYHSTDGGLNWQLLQEELPFLSPYQPGMYFFDASNALFYSHTNKILRTNDGGQSFQTVDAFPENDKVLQLEFVTPQVGYAATQNLTTMTHTLYRSSDGGNSWQPDLVLDSIAITRFNMLDAENGYALDWNSRIYRRSGVNSTANPAGSISVDVFPNPASNQLVVQLEKEINANNTLSLYTPTGKQIFSQKITQEQTTINLPSLPNGVYYYRLAGTAGKLLISQ